jgi:AcrR family transcriptional regulator
LRGGSAAAAEPSPHRPVRPGYPVGWHNGAVTDPSPSPRRGRPRDPDVEARVFDAAIDLYARAGWIGFNFESVTRATGIGKAALYRRWANRAELLTDALKARWLKVAEIDTGCLREDLLAVAHTFLKTLTGPHGGVHMHILTDTAQYQEVRDATADYRAGLVLAGRAIVRRAIGRGELPEGSSPSLIIDLVVGGIHNHIFSTPPDLRPKMEERMYDYAEQLVDAVLLGTGAVPRAGEPGAVNADSREP